MAIIKVTNTFFSTTKTMGKALKKCQPSDEIHVAPALYKENLNFQASTLIIGHAKHDVIIEGAITIPKNCHVVFRNLTILPTAHIHLEGSASFEEVLFDGKVSNAILSLAEARVELTNCVIQNAKEIGIAAFKNSEIIINNCQFLSNGKTHVLLDNSTGTISQSEFSESTHALWLKNHAKLKCVANQLMHQKGTQIIVQQSTFLDDNSHVKFSEGNGLFASNQAIVELTDCHYEHHSLPQLWVQESEISCVRTFIENGEESGLMIRQQSSCSLTQCTVRAHKIANIQLCLESRLNMSQCHVQSSEGLGVQIREKSIANIEASVLSSNRLAQLFITEKSIVSLSQCMISEGKQVGLIAEKKSHCTMLSCDVSQHLNSGVTIIEAEFLAIECKFHENLGNGVLVLNDGIGNIENSLFERNKMPHIGGKNNAKISVSGTKFKHAKSFYAVDGCISYFEDCYFLHSDGVQIELNDQARSTFSRCQIRNGKTNAIKLLRNSTACIYDCQISNHRLPQIVANDSSFVIKNSEIIDGERNGFIIENHAEAHIEDSFIARHKYPQIWVDLQSNVELSGVQLTEGVESDLYLQNESTLYAIDTFIQNNSFSYNIQSINNSKIELQNTIIEHFSGDCFYTENNSEIITNNNGETDSQKK